MEARQPGAISSVTQHPPAVSRASTTSVDRPARASRAPAVRPLWPALTTMTSQSGVALMRTIRFLTKGHLSGQN